MSGVTYDLKLLSCIPCGQLVKEAIACASQWWNYPRLGGLALWKMRLNDRFQGRRRELVRITLQLVQQLGRILRPGVTDIAGRLNIC